MRACYRWVKWIFTQHHRLLSSHSVAQEGLDQPAMPFCWVDGVKSFTAFSRFSVAVAGDAFSRSSGFSQPRKCPSRPPATPQWARLDARRTAASSLRAPFARARRMSEAAARLSARLWRAMASALGAAGAVFWGRGGFAVRSLSGRSVHKVCEREWRGIASNRVAD